MTTTDKEIQRMKAVTDEKGRGHCHYSARSAIWG